jgi:hypothetical protein
MEFNLEKIWTEMTIPVKGTAIFMVILSIYSIYVIIERFLTYSAASKQSISYVLSLREHLAKRRVDDALKAAALHDKSPVAKVVEAGLKALKQGREALTTEGPDDVGNFDIVDSVNRAVDRVKERETSRLKKGLGGLASTASATPSGDLRGADLHGVRPADRDPGADVLQLLHQPRRHDGRRHERRVVRVHRLRAEGGAGLAWPASVTAGR